MINSKESAATRARIPTEAGEFYLIYYPDPLDGKEHLAIAHGNIQNQHSVLTRVHSECFTGDVLGSQRCDCGEQLQSAMHQIVQHGSGLIIYLRQEGRGIGLEQKLRAYNLQDQGHDTVDANLLLGHAEDERDYSHAATILHDLGVHSIQLLTNNPAKIDGLKSLGIAVDARIPLVPTITSSNKSYIRTKVERMQHLLDLPNRSAPSTGDRLVNSPSAPVANGSSAHSSASSHSFSAPIQKELDALAARADQHFERIGLPFVTLSYAQSIDGSIAESAIDQPSQPLLLSGPESMRLTHSLRAQHSAILVGIGTLLADDPRLNVRLVDGSSPQPIILDSQHRCPPDARIFQQHKSVWIATTKEPHSVIESSSKPSQNGSSHSAKILPIDPTPNGQVDLFALLKMLGQKGIRSIMVEGGAQVISSFLNAQLVDQLVITIAPTFVGGLSAIGQGTLPSNARLDHPSYTPIGDDLVLWGQPIYS